MSRTGSLLAAMMVMTAAGAAWAQTVREPALNTAPLVGFRSVVNPVDMGGRPAVVTLKGSPGLVRDGTLAQMGHLKVGAGPGIRKGLSEAMARAMSGHDRFQRDMDAARGLALFGEPKTSAHVFEFPDHYVLTRSTSAVVRDPGALASNSRDFAEFMATGQGRRVPDAKAAGLREGKAARLPVNGIQTLDSLKPAAVAGLRDFREREALKRPPGDPLRQAADRGEEELLQAICQGVGPLELEDTFIIPKTAFPLVDGVLQVPFPTKYLSAIRAAAPGAGGAELRATGRQTEPVEKPELITSGCSEIHARFIAGFTLGNEWTWTRRWSYPSGFFRITLGASYGVGLRIPIQVDGTFSPTRAIVRDTANRPIRTTLSVSARAVDGDAAFYRDAGIPEGQLFGAKEAVLEARFGFGYKFRALWEDISSRDFSYIGLDESRDFTPPTGRDGDAPVIEIPPRLTGTQFDFPGLEGSATFGIRLVGTGTILMDHETLSSGGVGESRRIEFRSRDRQSIEGTVPAVATEYGFRLKDPAYRYDLELVPTVKLSATLHCSGFSRGVSTGWIDLNSLSVDVGTVTLARHAGTRRSVSSSEGRKEFRRIQGSEYMPLPGDRFHVTVRGKYLRAGLSGGLKADGDRPSDESLFACGYGQQGDKTITHLKSNYGDGMKLAVGGIRAAGQRDLGDRVETDYRAQERRHLFRFAQYDSSNGGKVVVIKSSMNGKYLTLHSDGTLHADGEDLQKAARFQFWPER